MQDGLLGFPVARGLDREQYFNFPEVPQPEEPAWGDLRYPVPEMYGWYDSADVGSLTITGQGISTWGDKSGNGRDLTQGNNGNRPIYPSGRYIGGIEAPDFQGGQFVSIGTFANHRPCSLYYVLVNDGAGYRTLQGGVSGGATLEIRLGNGNEVWEHCREDNGNGFGISHWGPIYWPNDQAWTHGFRMDTSALCRINLSGDRRVYDLSIGQTIDGASGSGFKLGCRGDNFNPWDGLVGELIFYNRFLTDVEDDHNCRYLKQKWSVPWTRAERGL